MKIEKDSDNLRIKRFGRNLEIVLQGENDDNPTMIIFHDNNGKMISLHIWENDIKEAHVSDLSRRMSYTVKLD